jgi:hypothetical protein
MELEKYTRQKRPEEKGEHYKDDKKTARVSDRRGNNKCMQNIYVGTAWNAKVLTTWEGFKINVTWNCPEDSRAFSMTGWLREESVMSYFKTFIRT